MNEDISLFCVVLIMTSRTHTSCGWHSMQQVRRNSHHLSPANEGNNRSTNSTPSSNEFSILWQMAERLKMAEWRKPDAKEMAELVAGGGAVGRSVVAFTGRTGGEKSCGPVACCARPCKAVRCEQKDTRRTCAHLKDLFSLFLLRSSLLLALRLTGLARCALHLCCDLAALPLLSSTFTLALCPCAQQTCACSVTKLGRVRPWTTTDQPCSAMRGWNCYRSCCFMPTITQQHADV